MKSSYVTDLLTGEALRWFFRYQTAASFGHEPEQLVEDYGETLREHGVAPSVRFDAQVELARALGLRKMQGRAKVAAAERQLTKRIRQTQALREKGVEVNVFVSAGSTAKAPLLVSVGEDAHAGQGDYEEVSDLLDELE